MTDVERQAWLLLCALGARRITINGEHALYLSTIKIATPTQMALFIRSLVEVIGTSGSNRWAADNSCIATKDAIDPAIPNLPGEIEH